MWLNCIRLGWREIRGNKMRSFLTILGIVIGTGAVVTIVTLSEGLEAKVTKDLNGIGGNLLTLRPGQVRKDGSVDSAQPFTPGDVLALRREVATISDVTPLLTQPVTAIYGSESVKTSVNGTDNNFLVVRNRRVIEGRGFSEAELVGGRAVCIIGSVIRRKLFHGEEALDASIRFGNLSCQVIGILDQHGEGLSDGEDDDLILVPILTVQNRLVGRRDVGIIFMNALSTGGVSQALTDVRTLMRERRHSIKVDDDFDIHDLREVRDKLMKALTIIGLTLGVIAAISLLVGGIGIMNIMLVSVTERTREIGTRLAVGAMPKDVLVQFLIEAILLSVLGGIIGIALGLGLSSVLAKILVFPFILKPGLVMMVLLFSGCVGLVFGFMPARKAARLPPAEAMRFE